MKIWFLLLLLISGQAIALDLEYFKFTNNSTYSNSDDALLSNGLGTARPADWLFTAAYDYVKVPLSVEKDQKRDRELVRNQNSLHLGGAWRPTKETLIGARTHVSQLDTGKSGTFLGDSIVEGQWKFYEESAAAVSLHPRLTLPTGSSQFTSNSKKVGGYLGLNLEKKFAFFQGVINVGYSHQPGALFDLGANFSEINYKDSIFTAIGTLFPLIEKWSLNIEAYRYNQMKGNQHPNELYAGIRHATTNEWTTFGGISSGGWVDESSNDYRISAGIKFSPGAQGPQENVVHAPRPQPKVVAAPAVTKREQVLQKEKDKFGKLVFAENVYFGNNSVELTALSRSILSGVLKRTRDMRNYHIVLEGFASLAGMPEKNLVLSEKRAEEVKTLLVKNGRDKERIKTVAYGDSRADASMDEALNRKVMIRIYSRD